MKFMSSTGASISTLNRTDFMIFPDNSVIDFPKYGDSKQRYSYDRTLEKRPILILFYFLKKENDITEFIRWKGRQNNLTFSLVSRSEAFLSGWSGQYSATKINHYGTRPVS